MKLSFNYGSSVVTLPFSITEKLDRATKKDIKVLFFIASDKNFWQNIEEKIDGISDAIGITHDEVNTALAYWRGAGVIDISDGESAATAQAAGHQSCVADETEPDGENIPTERKLSHADVLPNYTTDELTRILSKRKEMHVLIDECQRVFGKVFNTSEINILIGLSDYLGLEGEYILLLFAHCGKMERKSVRTVEKLALKFIDEGIIDTPMLEEHLKFLEDYGKIETKIRTMFGIGTRALTLKEKKLVSKWITEYKFDYNIIEKAYEVTVNSTQNPSLPYAGAVLDRWHSEGLKTLDAIDADLEKHHKTKSQNGGSFDTDEFLDAAIKRSLEGN